MRYNGYSMDWGVYSDKTLSSTAKVLYCGIYNAATEEDRCIAPNSYFAKGLGLSDERIRQLIRELEEHHLISVENFQIRGRQVRRIRCTTYDERVCLTPQIKLGSEGTPPTFSGDHPPTFSGATYNEVNACIKHVNESVGPNLGAEAAPPVGPLQHAGEKTSVEVLVLAKVTKRFNHSSLPYMLSGVLLSLIERGSNKGTIQRFVRTPEGRESKIQQMALSFDYITRLDGHPANEVLDLLEWCQKDKFWRKQILSGENFRKHYDQMLGQMQKEGFGHEPVSDDPNPEVTIDLIKAFRQLSHNPNYRPRGKDLIKFVTASAKAVAFFKKRPLCERNMWRDLITECLEKKYLNYGEDVYAGHMCSDFTWDVLMPEYVAKTGLI